MSENEGTRLDTLEIDPQAGQNSLWFNGPAEFLCFTVAKLLRADEFWGPFFGVNSADPAGFIDHYMRMDYPARSLPALRIYNDTYDKQFESWFIEGDLTLDAIFPASIRREETQQIPDSTAAAMLQQFRRPSFFDAVEALVPGLNELGKRFSVDKSMGFVWGEDSVPLTQMRVNFKIDLRVWDDNYLEQTNRTKDQPYKPTLGDLQRIVTQIQALRENVESPEVVIEADQNTTN